MTSSGNWNWRTFCQRVFKARWKYNLKFFSSGFDGFLYLFSSMPRKVVRNFACNYIYGSSTLKIHGSSTQHRRSTHKTTSPRPSSSGPPPVHKPLCSWMGQTFVQTPGPAGGIQPAETTTTPPTTAEKSFTSADCIHALRWSIFTVCVGVIWTMLASALK